MEKVIFWKEELEQLNQNLEKLRQKGKNIVWTNWCFDILHPGHLKTFEVAKYISKSLIIDENNENVVVVWLNWDKNPYWKTKPGRPINDEYFRAKMLAGLKDVNYVYIFNDENPSKVVDFIKPDIVLKGGDYYLWKWKLNSEKWIIKNERLTYLLENIEQFIKEEGWILDITEIYKYILKNNLESIASRIRGYMPEWLVNVKNWWKVVLVPVVWNYSTTRIIEKIKTIYCTKYYKWKKRY